MGEKATKGDKEFTTGLMFVDCDYHHGDGTEWAFYDDPSVLFYSTHTLFAFPSTGAADRTGRGTGKGFDSRKGDTLGDFAVTDAGFA